MELEPEPNISIMGGSGNPATKDIQRISLPVWITNPARFLLPGYRYPAGFGLTDTGIRSRISRKVFLTRASGSSLKLAGFF